VSVDARPTQKKFAEEVGAQFSLLSDWEKDVSRLYGVLNEERGIARRTTFLIDKEGIIRRMDSGSEAIDIAGLKDACAQLQ
jgi:peroxiredoxin